MSLERREAGWEHRSPAGRQERGTGSFPWQTLHILPAPLHKCSLEDEATWLGRYNVNETFEVKHTDRVFKLIHFINYTYLHRKRKPFKKQDRGQCFRGLSGCVDGLARCGPGIELAGVCLT